MIVLGLHTADMGCEVAIVTDDSVLVSSREPMRKGQDVRLPGMVSDALSQAGLGLSDIDRIAVVTGPGSFTGVRVGLAFATGLALALDVPCIGVTSLEAALPAGQQGSAIVAFPAQKRPPDITYWTQTFRSGEATGPAREQSLEALCTLLRAHPHMVYGSAQALQERLPTCRVHATETSAQRAAELARSLTPDTHPPVPSYARAPDAALPGGKPAP